MAFDHVYGCIFVLVILFMPFLQGHSVKFKRPRVGWVGVLFWNWSFGRDLMILIKTVLAVLTSRGSF